MLSIYQWVFDHRSTVHMILKLANLSDPTNFFLILTIFLEQCSFLFNVIRTRSRLCEPSVGDSQRSAPTEVKSREPATSNFFSTCNNSSKSTEEEQQQRQPWNQLSSRAFEELLRRTARATAVQRGEWTGSRSSIDCTAAAYWYYTLPQSQSQSHAESTFPIHSASSLDQLLLFFFIFLLSFSFYRAQGEKFTYLIPLWIFYCQWIVNRPNSGDVRVQHWSRRSRSDVSDSFLFTLPRSVKNRI